MQPQSFEDYIKNAKVKPEDSPEGIEEDLAIDKCPTPGCKGKELSTVHEDSAIIGFSCDKGCEFSVKRDAFTGEIIYFKLEKFNEKAVPSPDDVKGMKFTVFGEVFTDWY
ncbi:MAG: hypothetical protein ABIC40_08325 [bacterium]